MRNILAIASKELKSYFSSPIGWILLGFWSLLYGYFFVAILNFFVRQSMQMSQFGQAGPQAMNLNQQLLRPLVAQNLPILVLFLLPAVTMRTYSEERRSGTIELLLKIQPDSAEDVRDRGLLYAALDCYGLAARDLEAYLGMAPGAPDRVALKATIEQLRHKQARVN